MSAVAKYRKRPVVIEALRFTGTNLDAVSEFIGEVPPHQDFGDGLVVIHTLEGKLAARPGDWIIKGVKGEFYPCRADIFEATYEAEPEMSPAIMDDLVDGEG